MKGWKWDLTHRLDIRKVRVIVVNPFETKIKKWLFSNQSIFCTLNFFNAYLLAFNTFIFIFKIITLRS